MGQWLGYLFFRLIVGIFGIFPLNWLYRLSDLISFLLKRVIKYRSNIIEQNVHKAFPNRNDSFYQNLIEKYYRHLSDLFIESIKGYSLTSEQFDERFLFENEASLIPYYEARRSIIVLTSHIGNWEWAAMHMAKSIPHQSLGIYKPLSNRYIEEFVKKSRTKYDMVLIPVKQTPRVIVEANRKPSCIILVSDQSPTNMQKSIWVSFFGQDTPFVHGADDIARKFNYPVFYADIQRIKRGKYKLCYSLIHENPENLQRGELTKIYAEKLEELINKNPSDCFGLTDDGKEHT